MCDNKTIDIAHLFVVIYDINLNLKWNLSISLSVRFIVN